MHIMDYSTLESDSAAYSRRLEQNEFESEYKLTRNFFFSSPLTSTPFNALKKFIFVDLEFVVK